MPESIVLVCALEQEDGFPRLINPDLLRRVILWLSQIAGENYIEKAKSVVGTTRRHFLKASS